MRESDFVARLGGDEFAIIAERVCTHADAETVAQRIYQALSPRMVAHGNELTVGVSIGIALFPESGEAVEDLLNAADMAMYASKRLGDSTPMLASMLPRPDTKPPA
jgi:diguanylate cyclase (GGDEF)-like protein